jgi:hypothetical protein
LRSSTNSDKARAEALFKKDQRLRDGQMATATYAAEQLAIQQKTARLRALRIARDAAENNNWKMPKMDGTNRRPSRCALDSAGRHRKSDV